MEESEKERKLEREILARYEAVAKRFEEDAASGCGCGASAGGPEESGGAARCCSSGPKVMGSCCDGRGAREGSGSGLRGATRDATRLDTRESGLGCARLDSLIELYPGEVLLDIGSGPGLETSKLARRVDPAWAFGLDLVARMVKVASENARRMGVRNVSFLKGSVEDIPLADESVDVVVSNCVINLAMDKERAMREVLRVLRPGGRLAVADIVWLGAPSASVRESAQAWASCVGGALEADEYLSILARVGFENPRLKVLHAADALASSACCESGCCESGVGQDDDEGRAEGGTRSVCGCTLPPEAPALASALVTAKKGGFPDGAIEIRRAEPGDLGIVVRILEAAGLPVAGVEEHFGEFMVAQAPDGTITGAAGLEAHSSSALLRSVAVLPRWRGTGVGRRLVSTQLSRLASGTHVYLLTTTAEAYFRSFGFERISAEDVPEELRQSREFQGACPESAAVMRLVLS